MMQYFVDQINSQSQNFVNWQQELAPFTASLINGNIILLKWDTLGQYRGTSNFVFPKTIPGPNGKLIKLPFNFDWSEAELTGLRFLQKDPNGNSWRQRRVKYGRTFDDQMANSSVFLYDMFPNDNQKFWDTDGDGQHDGIMKTLMETILQMMLIMHPLMNSVFMILTIMVLAIIQN